MKLKGPSLLNKERRRLFTKYNIIPDGIHPSDFDKPKGGYGAIFPITRGLTKTMHATSVLKDVQNKEDKTIFQVKELLRKLLKLFMKKIASYHLELLCCEGCIVGPGIREKNKEFSKYIRIQEYVSNKLQNLSFSS